MRKDYQDSNVRLAQQGQGQPKLPERMQTLEPHLWMEAKELFSRIFDALGTIDKKIIFDLLNGYRVAEIAKKLKVTPQTINRRKSKAIQSIRNQIKTNELTPSTFRLLPELLADTIKEQSE